MILDDEVRIVVGPADWSGWYLPDTAVRDVTVPANVGYRQTVGISPDGRDLSYSRAELQAQIEPLGADLVAARTAVMWRGKVYRMDGPMQVFRRHGEDHHWVLSLKGEA